MFKFKGKSSREFNIVIEEPENLLKKSLQSYEVISIEGRDDADYIPLGYKSVEVSLKLQLLDPKKLDDVYHWLQGEGLLEYKERVTKARFFSEMDPLRASTIKIIDVSLIRSPFWRPKYDYFVESFDNIANLGNVKSKPIIRLSRTNEDVIRIKVNDITFKYDFKGEESALIDCEEMSASFDGLSRNKRLEIGFQFPELYPGRNEVKVIDGDAKIEFKRKDVWL